MPKRRIYESFTLHQLQYPFRLPASPSGKFDLDFGAGQRIYMFLIPKGWATFQHYKSRRPPWIKLYRSLLDDADFHSLPDASKALAMMLWLIASEHKHGIIDAASNTLAFRLRTDSKKIEEALSPLIDSGFFLASNTLADCQQHAIPETEKRERHIREREEKAVDKYPPESQKPNHFAGRVEIIKNGLAEKLRVKI